MALDQIGRVIAAASRTWKPERAGPALIVCARGYEASPEPVAYPSFAAAAEADRLLDKPCGEGCLMRHYLVWTEVGAVHVRCGIHDPPQPLTSTPKPRSRFR